MAPGGLMASGGQASGRRGAEEHWVGTDHRPCEERSLTGAFEADKAVLSPWGGPGAFGPPRSWRVWIPVGSPASPEQPLGLSELPRMGLGPSSWLWAPPAGHQGSGAGCLGMGSSGPQGPSPGSAVSGAQGGESWSLSQHPCGPGPVCGCRWPDCFSQGRASLGCHECVCVHVRVSGLVCMGQYEHEVRQSVCVCVRGTGRRYAAVCPRGSPHSCGL